MDVVLDLDDGGSAMISWAMDGLVEGLALGIGTHAGDRSQTGETDVTEITEWRGLIGRSIDGVAAAWHVPNDGCPDTLWAVRLSLSGGESVTIALGELEDSMVQYQPDALVVLFGEASGRDYRPPASPQSAFGTDVTT